MNNRTTYKVVNLHNQKVDPDREQLTLDSCPFEILIEIEETNTKLHTIIFIANVDPIDMIVRPLTL